MLTLAGVAIALLGLRDVRHELFHPEMTGTLSRMISDVIWRISRRIAVRHRPAIYRAGPVILVAIGAAWVGLVAVGIALIDLAHLPQDSRRTRRCPPLRVTGSSPRCTSRSAC